MQTGRFSSLASSGAVQHVTEEFQETSPNSTQFQVEPNNQVNEGQKSNFLKCNKLHIQEQGAIKSNQSPSEYKNEISDW